MPAGGKPSRKVKMVPSKIVITLNIYKATWLIEGKTAAVGVGMEVENGLAIGWHRVKD